MKLEPTHIEIVNRAFEIYVSRGGEHGQDPVTGLKPTAKDGTPTEEAGGQATSTVRRSVPSAARITQR
jgi:hypothetical protein